MTGKTGTDAKSDSRRLLRAIRALLRRFSISERADVSCCGMTVAQAATLEVLRLEGAMKLSALGRRLGISPSTLTRNLRRIVDRGLVTRSIDPEDARVSVVSLTSEGTRAAAELEDQEIRFAGAILDLLPPDRRVTALGGLEDLLRAVRQATESCCGGAFDHLLEEPDEQKLTKGADHDDQA